MAAGSLFVGAALLDIEPGDELVGSQQMAHRFGCAVGQEFHRLHRDAGQSRHSHPRLRLEDEFRYRRGDVLGLGVLQALRAADPRGQFGVGEGWQDRGNHDSSARGFQSRRVGEAEHPVLGGAVGGETREIGFAGE